ncbi:MAG: prealbumin-like fold domain-containing protein, partial [Gemmatimonadales bacterium]
VIRGLHAEMALLLAVRAEGYPAPQQMFGTAGRTRLEAHLTKLLVELDPPRTIRWPVAEGPPDKTRVTLRADYGSYLKEVPAGGVMDGKELVVAGWGSGPVHAVAVAPDGSLARLWAKSGAAVGRETSFLPPRQILVHVHQPDGTPIAGVAFQLRNQGNNPMGAQLTSDADGKVRFESLSHGRQADVYLLPNPASRWGGRRVGSVNLSKGSGTVDVILQPARDLVVHVLVAGRPGLPPSYRLTSNQTPVANVEADPDKGELRVRLRPPRADRRIDLQLFAEGFQLARASTTTDTMTLEMHRAGSLAVTVLPPSDKRFSLILQKWSEKSNAWTWGGGHARKRDPIRFSPLGLGRYRVMDRQSGKAGDPVEVPEGAEAVTSLDLSGVGWVKGRVEMPEGHSPRDVRILALGLERSAQPPSGIRIGRGETFMIRVPGDREITLRASHPSLTSDNEVKVTTPSDGVVLRLKKGLTATVHLDKTPPRSLRVPGSDRARVLLFNGPVGGKPAAELRALLDKKTITFGGFKPGQYTVWIDVRPFAPIVLRGVELKKADLNDLGTVQVSDGSSIKLKILVKPGQDPPRIGLFASSKTGPSYHRGLNSRGEAEVVLKGFGPGTFVVNGGPVMGGMGRKRPIEATIELDGTNQHTLTLDLRDG